MERTLLIGDHILVNKLLYRFTSPKRFDIIVFQYPWDENRHFIKRIVALPGEQIQIRDQQVYINDRQHPEPYARYAPRRLHPDFGSVRVPKKGDTMEIGRDKKLYVNGQAMPMPNGRFYPRGHGASMTGFEVFYGPLFPSGTTLQQPAGPLVVQRDYYFTLGDNRDNSRDSRYWGFVKSDHIRGKAFFIYWSWNRHAEGTKRVRWERLGQSVR